MPGWCWGRLAPTGTASISRPCAAGPGATSDLLGEGQGAALLGHPLDALAWIANKRARLGLGLAAGTFVTLGTITPVAWVEAPGAYRIEIEALGSVSVTVA